MLRVTPKVEKIIVRHDWTSTTDWAFDETSQTLIVPEELLPRALELCPGSEVVHVGELGGFLKFTMPKIKERFPKLKIR